MPTVYGPVSLRWRLSQDEKRLDLSFTGAWREAPRKIVLHPPPSHRLGKIQVNGKSYSASRLIVLKPRGREDPD